MISRFFTIGMAYEIRIIRIDAGKPQLKPKRMGKIPQCWMPARDCGHDDWWAYALHTIPNSSNKEFHLKYRFLHLS